MPRYSWDNDSAIAQADVKENLRYRYAILRPREGLDGEALQALPGQLQAKGLIATPETEDGAPILRVRGFKKASELFAGLNAAGATEGKFTSKEALEEELNPDVKSLRQYIREHSIQLAGAVYLIADAMPIASGIVRNTPSEIMQGSMWATTSAALLLFGRKNPEVQMGTMYSRMRDFMAQEGLSLDGDNALSVEQLSQDNSYWNRLVNFLYENPILFNNSIQATGGVMQIKAGYDQKNPFKTAAGFGPALGMSAGLLIPEDKYAGLTPEKRAEKLAAKARGEVEENGFHARFTDDPIAWVREKPLRLSGIGPTIGNFLTAASALFFDRHKVNEYFTQFDSNFAGKQFEMNPRTLLRDVTRSKNELLRVAGVSKEALCADRKRPEWQRKHTELDAMINRQIGLGFTMMTPLFNILANTLYGMSSKEERSVNLDKEGYLDELMGVAANIYAQLPEAARNEKIIRFAGFLRSQPDVNISEQSIRERMAEKIAALESSGWAHKVQNEPPVAEAAATI